MKRRIAIKDIDAISVLKGDGKKLEFVIHDSLAYDYRYLVKMEETREQIFEVIKRVWWNHYFNNLPIYVFDKPEDKELKKVVTSEDDAKKGNRSKHPRT
jgi:hypothetical protein